MQGKIVTINVVRNKDSPKMTNQNLSALLKRNYSQLSFREMFTSNFLLDTFVFWDSK